MEDDIQDGYFIPRGSLIIANIWSVLAPPLCFETDAFAPDARQLTHDPRTYANPMIFDPSRFLASEGKTPEPDPREMCFGFGRR